MVISIFITGIELLALPNEHAQMKTTVVIPIKGNRNSVFIFNINICSISDNISFICCISGASACVPKELRGETIN